MSLFSKQEKTSAQTVVRDVCKIKKGEKVLIVANPETNVIAQDLYSAAQESGAKVTLVFQPAKGSMDAAEDAVIGAIKSRPDVMFSVSAVKLGIDKEAIATPYTDKDGKTYDHIFNFLLEGEKSMRAVWTPGLTEEMFNNTVAIDYKLLGERCKKICAKYEGAVSVHVTSPNGTDVVVPVQGRKPLTDNGDFSQPGSGGNIPAGEVFISPVVGTGNMTVLGAANMLSSIKESMKGTFAPGQKKESEVADQEETKEETSPVQNAGTNGTIVFDGSLTFSDGDAMLETPITVKVVDGFVTDITGGEEAKRLLKDITAAERESLAMEATSKLPQGQGPIYCRNARNIGELGIGLNPNASVTGNMLEDEKAFRTCHFAIGENYDGDAPALIHFDGIVRNPTIVITYDDGSTFTLLDKGDLKI